MKTLTGIFFTSVLAVSLSVSFPKPKEVRKTGNKQRA
jgi:hypothetical protein